MKLKGVLLIFVLVALIGLASAIDLDIEKEVISDVIISELDEPAIFKFKITNNGERDSFELYSLVSVDISPKGAFSLARGESKEMNVRIKASETIKKNPGYFSFVYKIRGSNTGAQEDKLTIKVVNLRNVLQITSDNINPDSEKATIHVKNMEKFDFKSMEMDFSSVFFSSTEKFPLLPLEKRSFTTDLDQEKLKTLMAGPYLLGANVKIGDNEEFLESSIKFLEKSGLSTGKVEEGTIIQRIEIEKRNEGNLPAVAEISIEKSLLSRLFTTINIPPSKTERSGLTTKYIWVEELRPGESLKVIVKTNWIIPIVLVIAIIIIIILFNIYLKSDLILTKKISQVRTKGGEFALKVSINAKAKKYIERINVIDKLPPIVKLYKRYGTIAPDRIDEKNRRLEWNIESLNEGEDCILTYIIYSKIGIIGRFELPPAKTIYEKQGRIKETQSNRVFFISEPGKKLKEAEK